ncbi:MAG: 50S ribosomal protein L21 [Bacteroidetes bacterium OLB12]|nr:MAG: 50S ribosomal protein L21 [Bacteroidetes bacterium OLB12]
MPGNFYFCTFNSFKKMRSVYLLVGLFAVWCLLAAFWYLFWIKGLDPNTSNINPHESALAIAEILVIVLVSLFIGFGIAWFLRQQIIDTKTARESELAIDIAELKQALQSAHDQAEKAEQTLNRARETFRQDFLTVSRENERLKTTEDSLNTLQQQFQQQQETFQNTIDDLQENYRTAGDELVLLRLQKQKLEIELEELKKHQRETKEPRYSDFISGQQLTEKTEAFEKDDLKQINGIGPGIEAKLNKAGIFSFRQISELTKESTQQVAAIIEFFPGRITRDRWVEQASKLYLDKLRKE